MNKVIISLVLYYKLDTALLAIVIALGPLIVFLTVTWQTVMTVDLEKIEKKKKNGSIRPPSVEAHISVARQWSMAR